MAHEDAIVLRVSFPPGDPHAELLRRGIDSTAVADILPSLPTEVTSTGTVTQLVDYCFNHPTDGRFSDGSYGVFYSALEEATAIAEKSHHAVRRASVDGQERRFVLLRCAFSGEVEDLRGLEIAQAYLVDDAGYADCRLRARSAIQGGVDCFFTASARRLGGVCTPVFSRGTLSDPQVLRELSLTIQVGNWVLS